jgi:hypothetical protein
MEFYIPRDRTHRSLGFHGNDINRGTVVLLLYVSI